MIGRIGRVAAVIVLGGWSGGVRGLRSRPARGDSAGHRRRSSRVWWGESAAKAVDPALAVYRDAWHVGALRGAAKGLADNSAVYPPPTPLNNFMRFPTAAIDVSLILRPHHWWSPGVWIFLVLAVLIAGVLRYPQFGRHLFMRLVRTNRRLASAAFTSNEQN